ncbi:MAG: glucosyltransferase domain-containing protein, partial [Lachnospiraceae bacterium]|nr:glucosyltransferase domain-containing protein [Lachnospiraceae bacterium]
MIFWMAAHGFRFMNNLYTSDTLVCIFQDDILWQRSLGRFMQPATMIFRGCFASPWLLGIISIVFFTLSVYLISEILKIEDKFILFFICGILSCNVTITCALAGYTPWIDIYMTAFFFAVLGVWLFTKDKLICYIIGMF